MKGIQAWSGGFDYMNSKVLSSHDFLLSETRGGNNFQLQTPAETQIKKEFCDMPLDGKKNSNCGYRSNRESESGLF